MQDVIGQWQRQLRNRQCPAAIRMGVWVTTLQDPGKAE